MRSSRHTTAAREEAPRVSVDSACAPLKIKYESNRGRRPLSCPSAELTTAPRGQVLALVRHAQHDARAADGGRLRRFDGGQPRPRLPRCIPVSESTNALNRWAPSTSTSSSRRRTTPRGARRRTRQRRPRRPPSLASSRRTRRCSSTTSGGGARVSGVCSHSAGCEQAMQLDLEEALTRPVAGEGQQMPQPRGRFGEIWGDLGSGTHSAAAGSQRRPAAHRQGALQPVGAHGLDRRPHAPAARRARGVLSRRPQPDNEASR